MTFVTKDDAAAAKRHWCAGGNLLTFTQSKGKFHGPRMSPAKDDRFGHAVYDGVAVVTLLSRRYLSDSQSAFLDALRRARAEAGSGRVVVDFSRAAMVTSGPIGAMVAMQRQMTAEGGRIVAAGGGEFARKVLKFAANLIEHYVDVRAALGADDMPAGALAAFERETGS